MHTDARLNKKWIVTLTGLACCSLFLAWLTPFKSSPWTPIPNEFFAFVSVLCIGTILVILDKPIHTPPVIGLVIALACIPIIQWIFGVVFFFGDAFIATGYLLGFACALLVGYNLASEAVIRGRIYHFFSVTFVIAGVASTWIACRQWLFLQNEDSYLESFFLTMGKRPISNIGQPNNLATLLCMSVISVLYLFEQRRIGSIASSFIAFFLITGIALTRSATPWIDTVFLLVWIFWKQKYLKQRISWKAIIAWVALYIVFVITLPLLNAILFQGPSEIFRESSFTARFDLWHQFSLAVINGPLWGYGWNQAYVAQISTLHYFPLAILADSSHNILLDLLVWNGPILGTAIIILTTVWLCRLAYGARSIESAFALLILSFVVIHGMLEFPLQYAYFLLPVGFILGLVSGEQGRDTSQPAPPIILTTKAFALCLLISALMLCRVIQEYSQLEKNHNVQLSSELQPRYIQKTTRAANQTFLLTQLSESLRMELSTPAPNMTLQQLERMRQVAHRYPSPAHLCLYAAALALNNQSKLAIEELQYIRIYFGESTYNFTAEKVIVLQQQFYAHDTLKSQ